MAELYWNQVWRPHAGACLVSLNCLCCRSWFVCVCVCVCVVCVCVVCVCCVCVCMCVTAFWKTDQIVTLGLFHFVGLANGYMHTLPIHNAIIRLGWMIWFSRMSFADYVNSWLKQWVPWRAPHGRHWSEIHPSGSEMSLSMFGPMAGTS